MRSEVGWVQVRDDDGHRFLIPADKHDEWEAYMEAIAKYWGCHSTYEGEEPMEPEWAESLDGGTLVIKEYEIV